MINNWQLLPTMNLLASKIHSLNGSFLSPLGLKHWLSLSARNALMMGVVNILGVWLHFARGSLPHINRFSGYASEILPCMLAFSWSGQSGQTTWLLVYHPIFFSLLCCHNKPLLGHLWTTVLKMVVIQNVSVVTVGMCIRRKQMSRKCGLSAVCANSGFMLDVRN